MYISYELKNIFHQFYLKLTLKMLYTLYKKNIINTHYHSPSHSRGRRQRFYNIKPQYCYSYTDIERPSECSLEHFLYSHRAIQSILSNHIVYIIQLFYKINAVFKFLNTTIIPIFYILVYENRQ